MDIIRSKLNLRDFVGNNWFDHIVDLFKHEKVLSTWKEYEIDDSDADNKTAKFYINNDVYIEMVYTPAKILVKLYVYGNEKDIINVTSTSWFINHITIYKQNTYTGFSFKVSSSSVVTYTLETTMGIDSINNDPNNIVVMMYSGTPPQIYTSVSPSSYINSYWYYNTSGGVASNGTTNTIQLVPFVIARIDAQCDTLYGVCISPVMNKFVMFNNERWLITGQGIAIPCGDEINYYYVD